MQNPAPPVSPIPSLVEAYLIRPAESQEAGLLVEMIQSMAMESEGIQLDKSVLALSVSKVFDFPPLGSYWVIVDKSTPEQSVVGMLLVTYEWSDWHNAAYWWLQSVYLYPAHRGRGQFAYLLQNIEQEAQRAGSPELRLYVDLSNERAIRAYQKTGFMPGHYQVMQKKL